jgi:DNA-binding LacI/PurR family transcriptional regulator
VVSYALNGRRGVAEVTRERVLRVADELGWRPATAARSLRAGPGAAALIAVHDGAAGSRAPPPPGRGAAGARALFTVSGTSCR